MELCVLLVEVNLVRQVFTDDFSEFSIHFCLNLKFRFLRIYFFSFEAPTVHR